MSTTELRTSPMTPLLSTDFEDLAAQLRQSTVVVVGKRGGAGSGIIWDRNGLVVTNSHVIGDGPAKIQLSGGKTVGAKLVKRDRESDLAALQLEKADLLAASIGDSNLVRPGELVLAVGNPMGEVGAVSIGLVYASHPEWIRADVRLAPGNSGGPLANANGQVIGVNTMIAGGLAFAAPVQLVKNFLTGETAPEPASLGLTVRSVVVRMNRAAIPGLMVIELKANGPAAKGGLMVGDTLLKVEGRCFSGSASFVKAMQLGFAVNGRLNLDVLRGGKPIVVELDGTSDLEKM